MPTRTGSYDINSLRAVRFQSAAEFGLETINDVLQADLDAHNRIMQDLIGEFCEITTDRQRIYGTSGDGEMVRVDEYGRSPTQKRLTGTTVGFPLHMNQYAIGWTAKWLQLHTPAEMAERQIAAQQAHRRRVRRDIARAFFTSSNSTFIDYLVDDVELGLKALVNADGANIPDGPNGETFDGSTHTHYLARAGASLAASDILALIQTVVEHGHGNMVKIAINRGDQATVTAAMGSDFSKYVDPRIVYRNSDTPGETLDITSLDNRAIGIFDAAEVWVKPWVPANYIACWDSGAPEKPLAFRQRAGTGLQGLRIAATIPTFPLYAEYMEAEFGIGVWTRTNGAVLYFGNTTYADPVIA